MYKLYSHFIVVANNNKARLCTNPLVLHLTQSSGLALAFQKDQDIVLAHGTLDVSDDATTSLVDEVATNLCYTSARTSAAKNFSDAYVGYLLLACADFNRCHGLSKSTVRKENT